MEIIQKLNNLAEDIQHIGRDINFGGCGLFARQVKDYVPKATLYRGFTSTRDLKCFMQHKDNSSFNHFVLKIKGKFFDAEGFIDDCEILHVTRSNWKLRVSQVSMSEISFIVVHDDFESLNLLLEDPFIWNSHFRETKNIASMMSQSIQRCLTP
jgi:hypothetical protein